ncbi:MAG: RNA polymerase sigma factor RpoD/SigA [Acidimicrobiales bacterium]
MPLHVRESSEPDVMRLYLREIGRYPVLTREDEQRLGRRIDAGREAATVLTGTRELDEAERTRLAAVVADGEGATAAFLRANLRLVVSIAKRYQSSGMPLLDLVQEGNLGLIHALEKFDFGRGYKFSTYATWWIRQVITRAIANTGRTIRLPVRAGEAVNQVRQASRALEGELGRAPRVAEVAAATGLPVSRVSELLQLTHDPMSIFEPLAAEGDLTLADTMQDPEAVPPLDQVIAAALPAQVRDLLVVLDEREREVVCLRYGLDRGAPRTLAEVGRACGLSTEGARHVEQRALGKLRRRCRSTGLADLLAS